MAKWKQILSSFVVQSFDYMFSAIGYILDQVNPLLKQRLAARMEAVIRIIYIRVHRNFLACYSGESRSHEKNYFSGKQALDDFESLYEPKTGGWLVPTPAGKEVFDIKYDAVEREVGHLYAAFVSMVQPKTILETGVSRGYSTACLGYALKNIGKDGHVWAIDSFFFPHLWDGTDLAPYITFINKTSQEALEDLKHMSFDLLVIDSEHDYDTCFWEVCHYEELLKTNGYILMHDSIFFDGVAAVVRQLGSNQRFELVTLVTPRTHGNPESLRRPGLTIVRKIRDGEPRLAYDPQFEGWAVGSDSVPFAYRDR
jgi:predicted O-methyltransferase YrrM